MTEPSKTTILVSGASGIVGYGVLRSLRDWDDRLNLIGTTIYEESAAEVFADTFIKAPMTSAPEYLQWLTDTIERHRVNMIIPGIEADLYAWTDHHETLKATGAWPLLNDLTLIELCKDKWNFYEAIRNAGLPLAIESTLTGDFETLSERFGLPFLLKPRRGFASKGIVRVLDRETFEMAAERLGRELMAQPIVGDDQSEYSTSAFGDGQGGYCAHMTVRRRLAKEGYTEVAHVEEPEQITEALDQLCAHFKPLGPTNFQFRKHSGALKLLEINPRISSATSIRTAFGYNESSMAVDFFLHDVTPRQPAIRLGSATRYVEDFIQYA